MRGTHVMLHWRRALLAAHPEKADILAAELDSAGLLAKPDRPQPRGMVYADLPTLAYLDGVKTLPPETAAEECLTISRLTELK